MQSLFFKPARGELVKTIVRLIFVISISAAIYVLINWLLYIDTIEVVGSNIDLMVDYKSLPKNILFFPTERIKEQILRDNPLIKDVIIQKKFPRTLLINASIRSPIARLQAGGGVVLVDENGFVIGYAGTQTKLPLIQLEIAQISLGQKSTDERLLAALIIVDRLHQLAVIESVSSYDSASLLVKTSETNIYFPHSGDVIGKVTTLQTILSGFRIKGTLPKLIDLRFDKPIVTF